MQKISRTRKKLIVLTGRKLGDWKKVGQDSPWILLAKKAALVHKKKNEKKKVVGEPGRDFEKRVATILTEMKDQESIIDFLYHSPNSPEDKSGKDFSVTFLCRGIKLSCSFGVTIKASRRNQAARRYPNIPQFHFKGDAAKELIVQTILDLMYKTRSMTM